MIDLFIFDLGGVLVNDYDVIPEAARRMGQLPDVFRAQVLPDLESYMSGRMDSSEFWERFASRTGLRASENYWETLFHPVRDPAVEKVIRGIKAYGRVVCGTNTIDVHYEALRTGGHYDCFDAVYASHLMGVSKPASEFWNRILETEARQAENVFFADDLPENIRAARALGIRAHKFVDSEGLASALSEAGFPPGGHQR